MKAIPKKKVFQIDSYNEDKRFEEVARCVYVYALGQH